MVYLALILCAGIAFFGYQQINKGHRDISKEEPMMEIKATDLFLAFAKNGGGDYPDNVLKILGNVTHLTENSLILDDNVQVIFSQVVSSSIKKGNQITVKGRCIGYDDLLELVKIDQATVTK